MAPRHFAVDMGVKKNPYARFAKSVTLGSSIGDMLCVPVLRAVRPTIEAAMPPEYRRATT